MSKSKAKKPAIGGPVQIPESLELAINRQRAKLDQLGAIARAANLTFDTENGPDMGHVLDAIEALGESANEGWNRLFCGRPENAYRRWPMHDDRKPAKEKAEEARRQIFRATSILELVSERIDRGEGKIDENLECTPTSAIEGAHHILYDVATGLEYIR